MKFPATSFLLFQLISCPVVLVQSQSIQHKYGHGHGHEHEHGHGYEHGQRQQPLPSKVFRLVQSHNDNDNDNDNRNNLNIDFDIDIDTKAKPPILHGHGLTPTTVHRRIQSGEFKWKPLGEKIVGTAEFENSGTSIAMSDDGSIIAIGAPYNDDGGDQAGRVRVLRLTNGKWKQLGRDIKGKESEEMFGWSLDMSDNGTRLVIGGFWASDRRGVVRVYKRINDDWVQVGSDLRGNNKGDDFGRSVAMSSTGTVIAVGAREDDDNGTDSGSVFVYLEKAGSWDVLGTRLSGDASGDNFGRSVSLSGDALILAVGAAHWKTNAVGYVKLYKRTDGGGDWVQYKKINGQPLGDQFGSRVSLTQDVSHLAVSGIKMVKVYKMSEDVSEVVKEINVQYEATISFSNDERFLIVGDAFIGKTTVFQLINGKGWDQVGSDLSGDREFGRSVAISGDGSIIAVGNPDGQNYNGHVRVFKWVEQSPSSLGLVIGLCAGAGILLLVAGFIFYRRRKNIGMNANHAPSTADVPAEVADAVIEDDFHVSPPSATPVDYKGEQIGVLPVAAPVGPEPSAPPL